MPPDNTDLQAHIQRFKDWLKSSDEAPPRWQTEREERLAWYRNHLRKSQIPKLDQADFTKLVKDLWAVHFWRNKDYKVGQLLKDNGLDRIRRSLYELLYGSDEIDKRWDAFRASVKGLGPSSISELLAFHDPDRYALINLKPYEVMPRLNLPITQVGKGASYKQAIRQIARVRDTLRGSGIEDADFLMTDFFIAYLFYRVFRLERKRRVSPVPAPAEPAPTEPEPTISTASAFKIDSHESAEAALLTIGNLLGYDTYTPDAGRTFNDQKLGELSTLEELPDFTSKKIMESVRNIDVVWMKEEWPEYFFEVEHTTGVTPGLLRIYQAAKTGAKLFILGPSNLLKKFQREVEKSPFNQIKDKYHFRSYEELLEMHSAVTGYRSVSDRFLA